MRSAKRILGGSALLLALAGCGGTQRAPAYCEAPPPPAAQASHTGGEASYEPDEPMSTASVMEDAQAEARTEPE